MNEQQHNRREPHHQDSPEAAMERTGEETVEEPVLEGSDEFVDEEIDPRKGQSDPALIRDVESGKKTVNPYG